MAGSTKRPCSSQPWQSKVHYDHAYLISLAYIKVVLDPKKSGEN